MKKYTGWPGVRPYDPKDKVNFKLVKREVNGKKIDIIFRKGHPGATPEEVAQLRAEGKMVPDFAICPKLNPRTYIATKVAPHIECHQDLSMQVRDGTRLYFDLYKPADTNEPLPLII